MAIVATAADSPPRPSPAPRRRNTGQSISDAPAPCPELVSRASRTSLLESSKYSDVTLVCEGQDIKAHKFVLCARSPVWAAACDGHFQEAKTGRIDVEITDLTTLKRILSYLYEDKYVDESEVNIAKTPKQNDTEEAPNQGMQIDGRQTNQSIEQHELESEAVKHYPNNFQHNPDDYVLHEVPDDDACNCTFCNGPNGEAIRPSFQRPGFRFVRIARSNKVLINNIRVYAAADYYQILDLKQVAKEKFLSAADHYDLTGYDYLVEEVYGLTNDDELRETVAAMPGDFAWQLRFERRFNVRALAIQEYAEDFVGRLAEDKDDQRSRIAALDTTLEHQKKHMEQQKKANDAKVKSLEKALEQQRRQTEQHKKESIVSRDRVSFLERNRASTPTQQTGAPAAAGNSTFDNTNIPSLPPIITPPRLNISNRPAMQPANNRPGSSSTANAGGPPNRSGSTG